MESTTVVAVSLIVGGIILIFIDRFLNNSKGLELSDRSSFLVGVVQSIAMVPGVSRSAATIIGGRILGLNSEKAAEFSFILAVPTLTAASLYKLWKIRDILEPSNAGSLGLGVLFSFIFSIFAIKFFISVVNKHGFKYFGIYRIIVGMTVLIFSFYGAI